MKDPRKVADEVVRCIRARDLEGLAALFDEVNRRKFGPVTEANRPQLMKLVEKKAWKIGNVTKVGELREAPSFAGIGGVVALLRREVYNVFVVTLKKEGDDYVFDDINSPPVASYLAMKVIK